MIKAYKYRLYPTIGQKRLLNQMLEGCRWLYNRTLGYRRDAWEEESWTADWYETKRLIPIYKKAVRPRLRKVYLQVLQNDPRNTSKMCSRCGFWREKKKPFRVHICTYGLTINRDLNAVFSIVRLGMQSVGSQSIEVPHNAKRT